MPTNDCARVHRYFNAASEIKSRWHFCFSPSVMHQSPVVDRLFVEANLSRGSDFSGGGHNVTLPVRGLPSDSGSRLDRVYDRRGLVSVLFCFWVTSRSAAAACVYGSPCMHADADRGLVVQPRRAKSSFIVLVAHTLQQHSRRRRMCELSGDRGNSLVVTTVLQMSLCFCQSGLWALTFLRPCLFCDVCSLFLMQTREDEIRQVLQMNVPFRHLTV